MSSLNNMSSPEDRKRSHKSESSSTTSSADRPTLKKAKQGTPEDESHQMAGAEAAGTEAEKKRTLETDSAGNKKVKIKLIVKTPSKREEEQKPQRLAGSITKNQPSFYETFPGMPGPNLADAYQIPPAVQGLLITMDPALAARQRAKDDAHTLRCRRSIWKIVIAAAKEQGMTKKQWEGDYFEDTDVTATELRRVVVMEEQKRMKGKEREPSYHIESDEEGEKAD